MFALPHSVSDMRGIVVFVADQTASLQLGRSLEELAGGRKTA